MEATQDQDQKEKDGADLTDETNRTSARLARRDCGRVFASTCLSSQDYGRFARNVMEKGWAKIRVKGRETEKGKSEENARLSTEDVQRQGQGEKEVQDEKEEVTRGQAAEDEAVQRQGHSGQAQETGEVGKGEQAEWDRELTPKEIAWRARQILEEKRVQRTEREEETSEQGQERACLLGSDRRLSMAWTEKGMKASRWRQCEGMSLQRQGMGAPKRLENHGGQHGRGQNEECKKEGWERHGETRRRRRRTGKGVEERGMGAR